MPRADFYVLATDDPLARNLFAARLAEKAWRQQRSVLILCRDQAAAVNMDELLWNFRPDAFLPHDIAPARAPVTVSHSVDAQVRFDLIINLSDIALTCMNEQRLAEIVIQNPELLNATRVRFTRYRRSGYQVFTHKMPGE